MKFTQLKASSTIPELVHKSADAYGHRVAFSHSGSALTYQQWDYFSSQLAAYLQFTGTLEKGDRFAVLLPNLLQFPIALVGGLKAGMVVVNINPSHNAYEIKHILEDSGAKVLLVWDQLLPVVADILPFTSVKEVMLTKTLDMHAFSQRAFAGLKRSDADVAALRVDIPHPIRFRKALRIGQAELYRPESIQADDLALIQYTGGTTGLSKGSMLKHEHLLANMRQLHQVFEPYMEYGAERVVAPLPLYHIYSLTLHCLMMTAFGAHMALITDPKDLDRLTHEFARHKCSFFAGTNALFVNLCHHLPFSQLDFSALKVTCSGGAPLSESTNELWYHMTGNRIIEGYGLTEASPVVAAHLPGDDKAGTVGKPLPDTEFKILNEEGDTLGYGETGELWIKGPQVMSGYWNRPDLNARVFDGEWFSTGDIARSTIDGYLQIVDRQKDVIIVSGFPVYPSEVERIISCHPDVRECAVIAMPDEQTGQLIKLFVVSSNPRLSVREIRDYCRERLTRYKVPKLVEFRKSLPHTPVGKVLRRQLRDEELAKSSRQAMYS
jgi:long-chain acyl-CoA synthetase